jgi:hypothetical protein
MMMIRIMIMMVLITVIRMKDFCVSRKAVYQELDDVASLFLKEVLYLN